MKINKIWLLFLSFIILTGCISSKISIEEIKGTWQTQYTADKKKYYFFNYSSNQIGNHEPKFKAGGFTLYYTPTDKPYTYLKDARGSYRIYYDKNKQHTFIEMVINKLNNGRPKTSYEHPNHVGQKIIFEIYSVNQDTMKVLSDGEELILHRPTD